ncbi:MAG: hypothetical protein OSB70_07365 [Myxococcota bacterium]|nr:hypothetical protein [Myxococcota bacterium]
MAKRPSPKSRNRSGARSGRSATLGRLGFRTRSGKRSATRKKRARRGSQASLAARLRPLAPWNWRIAFPPQRMIPALITAVVVALGMAALRIDLIRARYETGQGYSEERRLNQEIASLTARMRELRDPVDLGQVARDRGFIPPELLIDLTPLEEKDPRVEFAHYTKREGGRQ